MTDATCISLCMTFQTRMSNVIEVMNVKGKIGQTVLMDDKICLYLNLLYYLLSSVSLIIFVFTTLVRFDTLTHMGLELHTQIH